MSANSKIEWTDRTWNPTTGCTEVSPGCDHCYAKTFAERFRGVPGHVFSTGFDVTLRPHRLEDPLTWRKPQRVFVNSMSDLFHRDVPDAFISDVFYAMWQAERHTFQVLTKRPERMRRLVERVWSAEFRDATFDKPLFVPPNIWLGVSIETNDYAWRADMLRETPAAVRFLSIEPMLGPVDRVSFDAIDWVIVGGESGHGARPMHPAWVRDVRDRCVAAGIPFFFKQWGAWRPSIETYAQRWITADGEGGVKGTFFRPHDVVWIERVAKKNATRFLDHREWNEFPGAASLDAIGATP